MATPTTDKLISRKRRAIYVFGCTAVFSIVAAAIVLMRIDNETAVEAVRGFLGLVQLIIIFYLSTTSIDRSEVLTNLGQGFRNRAPRQQTVVIHSPEAAEAWVRQQQQGDGMTGFGEAPSASEGENE